MLKYQFQFNIIHFINLAIVLCLISHPVVAKNHVEKEPEYQIKRYQKDIELDFKRGTIFIKNHHGNVTIKNTTHHTIGLSAVVQEIGKQPAVHELIVNKNNHKINIEIKYKKLDIKKHKKSHSQFPIGRVDLVFFIPVDYKIDVETTFGKIAFKRVKNSIKSKTKSGAINTSSYYDMQAKTESGQIKAFPMSADWEKGIKLESISGKIYAIIPVKANVELNVKSKGAIYSQLQSISQWSRIGHKLKKSYGKQGKPYHIKNKSGDVYLSPHESVK